MGLALFGQVELAVLGIEVRVPPMAVGEPGDADGPEDRRERPDVAELDRPVTDTLGVGDSHDPLLAKGAQVEMALEHLAQKVPTAGVELLLEHGVVERAGIGPVEPGEEALERRPRHPKGVGGSTRRAHRRPPLARRLRSRARPLSAWASSSALAVW